jgi:L-glyceraldehyde 3-phosphate reductase
MTVEPSADRHDSMHYRRCGHSGLKLPAVSLGLWHNFGGVDAFENARAMAHRAYGPPPRSAEEAIDAILAERIKG